VGLAYVAPMTLKRSDLLVLGLLVVSALFFTDLLRGRRPLGVDLRGNALAEQVQSDRASPSDHAPDANLTIVVFADYRCAACRRAHPEMKRAVAADGKVRLVYKDWPVFGALSARAAAVAIASSYQGVYPEVHDHLMRGPVRNDQDLRLAVEGSGGDWRRVLRDLRERREDIDDQLGRNRLQAFGLGLGGTPGYLIGPILVRGALTKSEFSRAFREARQGA
jgi:protein-disulfide isomerase